MLRKSASILIAIMVYMTAFPMANTNAATTKQQYSTTVSSTKTINIKGFGAHSIDESGYSDFDNSKSIYNAMQSGGIVSIPGKAYKLKSALKLKNGVILQGQKGQSRIIIDDSFTKGKYCPDNEFAIYNEHFSTNFNVDSADTITIDGIDFDLTKVSSDSITTILGFANVKKVNITNCRFYVKGSIGGTNLDIYGSAKNITIKNCEFVNTTNDVIGGCIWVRNLTSDPMKSNNVTENVFIDKCIFNKSSNDEAVAIYSVKGNVKNVSLTNSIFNFRNYPTKIPIAIYSNARDIYVKDVNFSNNIINVDDFISRVVMLNDTKSTGYIDNIKFDSNTINVKTTSTGSTKVISAGNNTNNITISNNKISNIGNVNLYTCIENCTIVDNNTITGMFKESSINKCNTVTNNKVSGSSIGNSTIITNNAISNTKTGIKYTTEGNFKASDNDITLIDDPSSVGIALQNLGQNPSLTSVTAENNTITSNNKKARFFFNAVGNMTLIKNTTIGNSIFIYGNYSIEE